MNNYYLDIASHSLNKMNEELCGDQVQVFKEDKDATVVSISAEENKETREELESNPSRYLLIPGLKHGQLHNIFINFTESDEMATKETTPYFGSIGGWFKQVNKPEIKYAFKDYLETVGEKEAEKYILF